jgi:hypothetical protein
MVTRKLFVFFVIAVFSLGLAGAGFSAGMVGEAKGGIVTKIENGKVTIKDNMGETTVEPTNSEVLTELRVGDKVSVKAGKLEKEVSTKP